MHTLLILTHLVYYRVNFKVVEYQISQTLENEFLGSQSKQDCRQLKIGWRFTTDDPRIKLNNFHLTLWYGQ